MAAALISGLLRKGHVPGAINVIERDAARAAQLAADYGVNASTAQPGHLSHQIVVLAVKPQHMHEALRNLRVAQDCTVVSVAAGLSVAQLAGDLPQGCTIVRCMPNSPALVGAGALVQQQPQDSLATLRANVTSKGGTTEAALAAFEDGQLAARVHDAAQAAAKRSLALRTPATPSRETH